MLNETFSYDIYMVSNPIYSAKPQRRQNWSCVIMPRSIENAPCK